MKRLFFSLAWLFLVSGLLLTTMASWQVYAWSKAHTSQPIAFQPQATTQVLAAAPAPPAKQGEVEGMETVVESQDARAELVSNFLQRYDSPLKPYDYYGSKLVEIADTNGFDFRLLPAIAMTESNLCKHIPEGTYNCLGFGIDDQQTLAFPDFESNFERAGKELKEYYIDQGLTTPEQIMHKYTPSSDGSWADHVNQYMAEMRYDDHALGRALNQNGSVLEFAEPSPSPQGN